MNRCIIHIGMHKTGSTSIQNRLFGLKSDHFVYAALGSDANHSLPIYSAFGTAPERHHVHRAHGRSEDVVRAYVEQVLVDLDRSASAARGRTLLISGEDIGSLPPASLVKLHDYVRSRFDNVTIVGYVRPPAALMGSVFQERVKHATLITFDPARMYRNYKASFTKFDEVFGVGSVRLWKFEPGLFPGGCVVRDFCRRLGIPIPGGRTIRLNESLPRQAVAVLYTYSKLGGPFGAKSLTGGEGMNLGLAIGGKTKFRLSPDVVRPILEANRADVEWMEERLGQPLGEDLNASHPDDIRDESDLLRPDPATVRKIMSLLGPAAPKGVKGETAEEIVVLVQALRSRLAAAMPEQPRHR